MNNLSLSFEQFMAGAQPFLAAATEGQGPFLRCYRLSGEAVSLGAFQLAQSEVRREFTSQENIPVVRRFGGGGVLYHDPGSWIVEWAVSRDSLKGSLGEALRGFGEAVAGCLQALGIKARFRPRGDLEVLGKRIGTLALATEGKGVLFQAFLLHRPDAVRMIQALQIPVEKLTSKGIKAAEDRMTGLGLEMMSSTPPSGWEEGWMRPLARALQARWVEEDQFCSGNSGSAPALDGTMDFEAYLYGVHRSPGGTLRVWARVDPAGERLEDIFIAGDLLIHPADALARLRLQLIGAQVSDIPSRIRNFFSDLKIEKVHLGDEEVIAAVMFPLRKLEGQKVGLDSGRLNSIIASLGGSVTENITKAKVVLLPYCAKPVWCDYRHLDACGECGGCTVGDAYRLARENDMIPVTITSFELLADTLNWCKENDYTFIGHCCQEFFEKRYEGFQKSGANGILFDIEGTTCYDLGVKEEEKAYHGEFRVELDLMVPEMNSVMAYKKDKAPPPPAPAPRIRRSRVELSPPFAPFMPAGYKKPKALPSPDEDRTRLPYQGMATEGKGLMAGEVYPEAAVMERMAELLKAAQRPALVVGPLVLWGWNEEALEKAKVLEDFFKTLPGGRILVLPDYAPRLKNYDPSVQVDAPNPHVSIQVNRHDVAVVVGLHCYRTDFVLRLIHKHTDCRTLAWCAHYGHKEATCSLHSVDAPKIRVLTGMLR